MNNNYEVPSSRFVPVLFADSLVFAGLGYVKVLLKQIYMYPLNWQKCDAWFIFLHSTYTFSYMHVCVFGNSWQFDCILIDNWCFHWRQLVIYSVLASTVILLGKDTPYSETVNDYFCVRFFFVSWRRVRWKGSRVFSNLYVKG